MGHLSREAGALFEKEIDSALKSARQQGIVRWFAHQQPLVTRAGEPIAQSGADFIFILIGGGNGAIECKSTTHEPGKPFRIHLQDFTVEQQNHLDACADEGGLSLAALRFWDRRSGRVDSFMVPWRSMPWRKLRTQSCVEPSDVDPHWSIPMTNKLVGYLRQCTACGAWSAKSSLKTACCFGALPF
jgi:hypothetical protein